MLLFQFSLFSSYCSSLPFIPKWYCFIYNIYFEKVLHLRQKWNNDLFMFRRLTYTHSYVYIFFFNAYHHQCLGMKFISEQFQHIMNHRYLWRKRLKYDWTSDITYSRKILIILLNMLSKRFWELIMLIIHLNVYCLYLYPICGHYIHELWFNTCPKSNII